MKSILIDDDMNALKGATSVHTLKFEITQGLLLGLHVIYTAQKRWLGLYRDFSTVFCWQFPHRAPQRATRTAAPH